MQAGLHSTIHAGDFLQGKYVVRVRFQHGGRRPVMQPYLLDSGLQKDAAQRAHRLQRNSGNPGLEDLCTIAGIYCLSDDCAIVSLRLPPERYPVS